MTLKPFNLQAPPKSTDDIRRCFLDYFKQHDHTIVQSASLVPSNDKTLLFVNSGMVQFKQFFLGHEKPPYTQAASVQCCMRAGGKHNDLDNVGYTARHHTFFEMLGNFSFGSYFKENAIQLAWHFLTQVLQIPPTRLLVTVFESDHESADIWLKTVKIDPDRLIRCGEDDNFWAMGPIGPCGPCSEIFYDHGTNISGSPPGSPDQDGDRYVEIWNLVFMQFNRNTDGTLINLPVPCVDTGIGLERLAAVMQGVVSNYHIDIFEVLLKAVASLASTQNLNQPALQVIADHIRAASFLVLDHVSPGNEGRHYVLRRIIRRASRHGYALGIKKPFLFELVTSLVQVMGNAYPALRQAQNRITVAIKNEEIAFRQALEQGMIIFEREIKTLKNKEIPGSLVFHLYDTYGFPKDLTIDMAHERGLTVEAGGFEKAMSQQRIRSQEASHFKDNSHVILSTVSDSIKPTLFVGYKKLQTNATVLALYRDNKPVKSLDAGECGYVVLDTTPFYAESGGQVGDSGVLSNKTSGVSFVVEDTQVQKGIYSHRGRCVVLDSSSDKTDSTSLANLQVGDKVEACVNSERRKSIELNHSATHLLHAALRQLLGEQLIQKGSLVDEYRLRFDFLHPDPLKDNTIQGIERLVNQKIRENLPGVVETLPLIEAKKRGAVALFGEKYGEYVRVLNFGDFSIELCGGTHVEATGEIGCFKILSEIGIGSGIRRIEAVTAQGVFNWIESHCEQLDKAMHLLKSTPTHWLDKLAQLIQKNKQLENNLDRLQAKMARQQGQYLREGATEIQSIYWVAELLPDTDQSTLCKIIDQLKRDLERVAIILGSIHKGKLLLVSGVTPACFNTIDAPSLLNYVAAQVGGKGGGRPDLAQGGGTRPERLAEALASVIPWVKHRDAQKFLY